MNIEVGGFTFISDFDSGNLGRVELVAKKQTDSDAEGENSGTPDEEVPDYEFNLWTRPDCLGTEYENGNRTWFYFGIKGGTPFSLVQLNIVDLNKQTKMYSQGMAPVYRVVPGRNHWERVKDKPHFRIKDNIFILTFKYRTLENTRAVTYFAFTYPFQYIELQNMLQAIDVRFKHQNGKDGRKYSGDLDDIYYHRECVCYSLEGRRVELITVSSYHHMTKDREPRLKYLFPDTKHTRPFRFSQKKVVFVSARVHPGETPSSFVLNGLLHLLLKRDDPVAILLRKNYVFKLIPMLNPDGVCRGHYRTDTRGVNLNRVYVSPSFALHPSIYAARSLILYYHHGQEIEEVVTGPVFDPASRRYKIRPSPVPTESDSADTSDVPSPRSIQCKSGTTYLNPDVHRDSNKISGIENQVSCLTLDEKNETSSVMAGDGKKAKKNANNVNSDMLSSICESFIKKVFDVNDLNSSKVSVVAGGIYNNPLVMDTQVHGSKSCSVVEGVPGMKISGEGDGNMLLSQKSDTSLSVGEGSIQSSASSKGFMKKCISSTMHQKDKQKIVKPNCDVISDTQVDTPAPDDLKKPYTSPENSGLFVYVDLHGHASKKGIFMYGNHFENTMDNIECMLLPKLMSLNSPNFHFSACNFTERIMYLRDRKDGSSREGCGRVSVLKTTGLVRSYTLECNYNTGRIVNVLPPCVRDTHKPASTPLVPPKYSPHIFEEIGYALGASILDLTGVHPWSRIPNSEFRTVNGIRDWIRANCIPEQMYLQKTLAPSSRHLNSRRQVVCLAGASVRMTRSTRAAASSCKNNRHDSKHRLAPLSTKPAKGIGCSSVSLLNVTDKSEDETSGNGIYLERKENVTSFHIISPPHSPEQMSIKANKVVSGPKENLSPGSSQKFPGTSKNMKTSSVGVLKQVLAVRAKCSSVGTVSGNSKVHGNFGLKMHKACSSGIINVHKKSRISYEQLNKASSSNIVHLCGDNSGNDNTGGFRASVGQDNCCIVDQESYHASKNISNEKLKYTKDETKGLIKHGPKRLKVSSLKPEQHTNSLGFTAIKTKSDKVGGSKLTLKEACYLNICKEKNTLSKFSGFAETVVGKESSSGENLFWEEEHNPEVVPLRVMRQSPLHFKSKLNHRNVVTQNSVSKSSLKLVKSNISNSNSVVKGKSSNKSEKIIKGKVPHLSPVKTLKKSPSLGRKLSGDSGKKWAKATLRNFATSVGKFKAAVKEETVCVEKKRKKSKIKALKS